MHTGSIHVWRMSVQVVTSIQRGVPVYGVLTRVASDCRGGDKYPDRCTCIRAPCTCGV